ncbi:adhesion G-protein coupled receptor G6-like isoform X2 [Octopus sinensis]|uniref:Adhesion G-protein coupled receptor G6-like isoform X2 n=1 Tax=Octopus sinensis TaxID=2607531 RepID=A0A7E6FV33_9MOLL|nr:adhesion G-protein coupled receptor G6-like isoform X2 [Octopus sinensis]
MLTLVHNKIEKVERGIFQGLNNLQQLYLNGNNISSIEQGSFQGLPRLQQLYLNNNSIQKYEDGAFFFLPSIAGINLENNDRMVCGCHLPAFVRHIKKVYSRTVDVNGTCEEAPGKLIPILKYSQCQNYSLFQRNLQCQTCSKMICNDLDVTRCPGSMPVCRFALSTNGVTLKTEKSCSTYRKCVQAMRDNTAACDKWPSGTTCTGCCFGNLCNKNDFVGWTKSFVFHLTFKKFNDYKIPTVNISRAMQQELLHVTAIFRVEYCGLVNTKIIYTMYCSVLNKISKDQLRRNISRVFTQSQALNDIEVQQGHMKLIDEMVCDENTTSTNNGTFSWPMTKIGTTAEIPCHAYVATRYCSSRTVGHPEMASSQNMSSQKCSPYNGIWKEPDMSQCYNTEWITRRLKDIARKNIDKGNINNISKEILDISQKSVYFKEEHIVLTVEILEKMVPLISKVYANITVSNVLRCINNLINIPEEVLAGAEEEKRSANRLMDLIQEIPEKIPLEEQQVTVLYSNLGIGVSKVNPDTFDGLFYGVSYGTNDAKEKAMINPSPNPDQQEADAKLMASISLPRSLLKHLKDEERSSVSRITFFSMRDDKLYRLTQNSSTKQNARINSHVLAASVPDIPMGNLNEPVNISFNLIHQNARNLQCVYWDESPGLNPHWSPIGCHISRHEPGKEVVCSCDYLTSFALLDIYQNEGETENAFSITSNIGSGISLAFLILTIIIHVCFRNPWDLMSSKVLVSLCSSLAVTNFIFLVGMQSYVQTMAGCKAVAALLHYFLLTSVMWMTVEAFHVYLSVVVVFKTCQTCFMKSSIFSWGLPAVIVIITLAINSTNNYIKIAEVCWLSAPSFYAAFLAPVAISLIFNIIMPSLVIWHLIMMHSNKRSEQERSKVRVLGLVGLLFLFGLTLVFAFFAVREAAKVFDYLFTIFNTLQGMFIFVFYCIYKKDTRNIIREFVNERKRINQWKITAGRSSSSVNEIMDKATETNI